MIDLFQLAITYKMRTHRNLLDIVERQLEEDFRAWQREIESTEIEFTGYDHYQWYQDEIIYQTLEHDEYMTVFLGSFFVSSFAMFENELMRICDYAQGVSGSPFSVKDFGGRDYLENAKKYLKRLGVTVPADTFEWKQATNYRAIRNKIMHEGGSLGDSDRILCFATENEILLAHQVIDGSKELELSMTREFCDKALNDMEKVLLQVNTAYRQWLKGRVQ